MAKWSEMLVRRVIATHLGHAVVSVRPVHRKTWNSVLRVQTREGRTLIVKIFKTQFDEPRDIEAALWNASRLRLSPAGSKRKLLVATPVLLDTGVPFFSDGNLVMAFYNDFGDGSLLRSVSCGLSLLVEFQRRARIDELEERTSPFAMTPWEYVRMLPSSTRPPSKGGFASLPDGIQSELVQMRGDRCLVAHGDFKAGNLLETLGGPVILDCDNIRLSLAEDDASMLLLSFVCGPHVQGALCKTDWDRWFPIFIEHGFDAKRLLLCGILHVARLVEEGVADQALKRQQALETLINVWLEWYADVG